MSKRGIWIFMLTALLAVGLISSCGCEADAKTPFGYKYMGTVNWVPGGEPALDMRLAFGGEPEMIVMYSSLDFRCFVMSTNKLANDEVMSTSISAAQLDSLYTCCNTLIPAAGKVVYGYLPWLVAPASADTIRIDGYSIER